MKQLTFQEMLDCAGTNVAAFRSLERRGRAALAFGAAQVTGELGRYFDLDSASQRLTIEVSKGLDQDIAPSLVRGHADLWLFAVALADTEPSPIYFQIGIYGEGKKAKYHVSAGDLASLQEARVEHKFPPPDRLVLVNVNTVLATVRANGRKAGIDLSAAFFPAPGDPLYEKLTETVREQREAALARQRAKKLPRKMVKLLEARTT
ncbi:MAG: hypothetical protein ACREDO_07990 [Methyloceanibacter sp.]